MAISRFSSSRLVRAMKASVSSRFSSSMIWLLVPSPSIIMALGSFSARARHFWVFCSTIRTLMPTFSTAHVRYVAMRLPPRTVICRSRPESRPRLWKNRTISCCEPMT